MPRKQQAGPGSSSPGNDPVAAWAKAVTTGTVVAGPYVRAACARHLRDLEHGARRGLKWDRAAAHRVIRFFAEGLRLAGGQFEGKPFVLQPSQAFIVGSIFGWKQADDRRRFRRAYIEQGKGSGKSPVAAGIGLYCLVADGEPRAEVYAAASMKSQAMVLFRDAVAMWQQSDELRDRLTPSGGNPIWNLADLHTGSFFRPISSEEDYSGPRPSCAVADELHEHRDGHMLEQLERGFKSRRQPLLIMITNAGSDRNSVCWEEHAHAIKVAAGEIEDDGTFSFVCALDDGDDPLEDPTCWAKANPLLGVTITEEYLAGVVRQAKQLPGKLNNILRLHFCRWTDAQEAWMSRETLEQVLADFDPLQQSGEDIYLGLDLSATQDLTAFAHVVQTGVDAEKRPTFDAWVEAWTPEATVRERGLRDKAPYELWIEQGHLHATPGKVIGFNYVAARLAEVVSLYSVCQLAYDSYRLPEKHFEPALDALGLTLPIVEHPQGGKRKAARAACGCRDRS